MVSPCVVWKKSILSAGKRVRREKKDERNDPFPTSSSWLGQGLHSRGTGKKKEADTRESSTGTALPKASPAASLLHSPTPLWRGNSLHLTPLHSAMLHHGQLSSYSSSGVCCQYLLLPYDIFFPNRAIHSVEIYFKEFRSNSLHFQIMKDGNCFTFARLISYQKHLADKRQKTDR